MAIDGGGIRGIIPTIVVGYLEDECYKYSLGQGYINASKNGVEKISMSDLFDMVAGTSTGSILATAIVTPSNENRSQPAYYSDTIYNLYDKQGREIFKHTSLNMGLLIVSILASTLIGGFLGFRWGVRIFADPEIETLHQKMRDYIRSCKKAAKAGSEDKSSYMLDTLGFSLKSKYELNFKKVKNGQEIKDKCDSKDYWKIKEAERILFESEKKYRESKSKKWIIMSLGLVVGGLLGYFVPVGIYKVTRSTYDRTQIDDIINKLFG